MLLGERSGTIWPARSIDPASQQQRNSSPTFTPKRSIDLVAERPVEFLDLDDLINLARILLGDPPPVRDVGLLASAVARPQTTVGGKDAYPTIWLKAAALLQSVVGNHALVDGNKRLGWLAVAVFLEINDASVAAAPNDDVFTLVMQVARSELALDEIADRLRQIPRRPPAEVGRSRTVSVVARGRK